MLSHGINIDEEELVALLIEGVPNQMQRNQARTAQNSHAHVFKQFLNFFLLYSPISIDIPEKFTLAE